MRTCPIFVSGRAVTADYSSIEFSLFANVSSKVPIVLDWSYM